MLKKNARSPKPAVTPERAAMLLAANAELRVRLEEAEETLRAIRSGDVDALVVEGPAGSQVFTLQGVDAQSNQFRGEILAQISDAVVAVDMEERITYLNAAAERQYGVVASEVLGRYLRELWTSQWPLEADEVAARNALRETGYWRGENIHRKRDGERIHVESAVICLHDTAGAEIGFLATIRDITQRKDTEERLRRAAEEAEAASQAKDDFLAALSHELRTPLTPVLMTAAAMELDPELPDATREQLSMIRRNIQLEARLIDDLLDLTHITRRTLQIHRVVVDVHELLGHSEEIVRSEAIDQGRVVEFRLEAREYHVMADPTRLQQVFWNLIKNALKFSEEGGRVTVRTLNPSPNRFAVRVADNGIGIAREALDRIFSAFDQGDLKGRHRFGGLGLGLAISKGIVDLHSGCLRVESEGPGRGATFTVDLETTVPEDNHESPSQNLPAQTRPIRLLIVEDHEPTLSTMKRLLERSGYRVCTAAAMSEALAVASANKCDVLISDLGLPDGSGLDLMREIHQRFGWPGIALTGYGMEDDIRRVTECGFGAHLVKPIDIAQLRAAIERLLAQSETPEELSRFAKNGGERTSRARSGNLGEKEAKQQRRENEH